MGINIDVKVRLSSKDHKWLCFRHAVQLAMQGVDIETEVDDFDSEHYLGSTVCDLCLKEEEARRNNH